MSRPARMTEEELGILAELEKAATPAPWGWKPTGEKSNDAVLATFYDNANKPIGGRVETERYDDKKGEYETIATDDEVIFYRENDADYTNFDFTCAVRNALPRLLSHIAAVTMEATVRPRSEYHEDFGVVAWWDSDFCEFHESPYIGSPLDLGWDERYLWWSKLPDFGPMVDAARAANEAEKPK